MKFLPNNISKKPIFIFVLAISSINFIFANTTNNPKMDELNSEMMHEIQITGNITFTRTEEEPEKLPFPSFLIVALVDASLMDAPSKLIGEMSMEISGTYKKGKPIPYELKVKVPKQMTYSLSAIIYVGKDASKKDVSLEKNDYINDTRHPLTVTSLDEYYSDIEVILV